MQFKINVSYSLVTFPAKYETATLPRVEMKNLCVGSNGQPAHAPKPLTAPKTCTDCGVITDFTGIKKGVKQGSGFAVVEQTDVADARDKFSKQYADTISLVPHPTAEVLAKTIPSGSVYYLTPASAANEDHYQLIRHLIEMHPEVSFCGLYTPRTATSLYQVVSRNDALVMQQLTQTERLKPGPKIGGTVNQQLYPLLEQMLAATTTAFDPATYEDGYEAAVQTLAAAATEQVNVGGGKTANAAAAVATSDDDLMAKLLASLGQQPS